MRTRLLPGGCRNLEYPTETHFKHYVHLYMHNRVFVCEYLQLYMQTEKSACHSKLNIIPNEWLGSAVSRASILLQVKRTFFYYGV